MRHGDQKSIESATEVANSIDNAVLSVGGTRRGRVPQSSREDSSQDTSAGSKINISRDADAGLKDLVARVNEGFEAGHVSRPAVASWIIAKFCSSLTESDVHMIRMSHYDEAAMLESIYRRARETGEVPEFLREALKKHFHAPDSGTKKKKSLAKGYISDVPLS